MPNTLVTCLLPPLNPKSPFFFSSAHQCGHTLDGMVNYTGNRGLEKEDNEHGEDKPVSWIWHNLDAQLVAYGGKNFSYPIDIYKGNKVINSTTQLHRADNCSRGGILFHHRSLYFVNNKGQIYKKALHEPFGEELIRGTENFTVRDFCFCRSSLEEKKDKILVLTADGKVIKTCLSAAPATLQLQGDMEWNAITNLPETTLVVVTAFNHDKKANNYFLIDGSTQPTPLQLHAECIATPLSTILSNLRAANGQADDFGQGRSNLHHRRKARR